MGTATKVNVSKKIVLFDGVCNLCNGAVNFIIKRDPDAVFHFASLQSDYAQDKLSAVDDKHSGYDSIVLIKDGNTYYKSDAALEIARDLKGFWSVLPVFKVFPRFFRDWIYDIIAKNRYKWFGKKDTCPLPTPELEERFLDS